MPHRLTSSSLAAICLLSVTVALAQDAPSKLPIEVPKSASVDMEAEGPGKEFLTTLKHLMAGNPADPEAPAMDKIPIKTPLGNIDLKLSDLAPLLEKIHMLHLVTYSAVKGEDPFKWHEKQFTAAGLKRVAYMPGDNGILITRNNAKFDSYGIVCRQKDVVVVLRTEGAPGLGDLGKVIFEAISRAAQDATAKKHGG